jgi:hypothetical protein
MQCLARVGAQHKCFREAAQVFAGGGARSEQRDTRAGGEGTSSCLARGGVGRCAERVHREGKVGERGFRAEEREFSPKSVA